MNEDQVVVFNRLASFENRLLAPRCQQEIKPLTPPAHRFEVSRQRRYTINASFKR
jgi:hypothetical protein